MEGAQVLGNGLLLDNVFSLLSCVFWFRVRYGVVGDSDDGSVSARVSNEAKTTKPLLT